MSGVDVERLRTLAEQLQAANAHGPWEWEHAYPQTVTNAAAILIAECFEDPDQPSELAEFIAAANPAVVLALLDRLTQAEHDRDELRGLLTGTQEELKRAREKNHERFRAQHDERRRAEAAEARAERAERAERDLTKAEQEIVSLKQWEPETELREQIEAAWARAERAEHALRGMIQYGLDEDNHRWVAANPGGVKEAVKVLGGWEALAAGRETQ